MLVGRIHVDLSVSRGELWRATDPKNNTDPDVNVADTAES